MSVLRAMIASVRGCAGGVGRMSAVGNDPSSRPRPKAAEPGSMGHGRSEERPATRAATLRHGPRIKSGVTAVA